MRTVQFSSRLQFHSSIARSRSRFYRDGAFQGGLYSNGFFDFWWKLQIEPQRNSGDGVDWREELPRHEALGWAAPTEPAAVAYPAHFDTAPADTPLELTGPVALRLWISSENDDLDVLARLQHLDVDGRPIPAIGPQGGPMPMAIGWLRASHRELDPARSEPYRPWHPHRSRQPLTPGEPTLLEVEIWPTSITLAPGERLRLELLSDDDDLTVFAHNDPNDHRSATGATIHTGGEHASHLLVPTIPG